MTDWLELCHALAAMRASQWQDAQTTRDGDPWRDQARDADDNLIRRWAKPDFSREGVIGVPKAHPDWTAMDIGGRRLARQA